MGKASGRKLSFTNPVVIWVLLVSVPFILLSWLLVNSIVGHQRQFSEAQQVIAVFRSGLAALHALDETRSLSRPANLPEPPPEITGRYESAQLRAEEELAQFFPLVHRLATETPALTEPLRHLEEELPTLREAGGGHENSITGPLKLITLYSDQVYALLATLLHTSKLPEGGGGTPVIEMLLLIPDSLRQAHSNLGVLHTLTIPSTMNESGMSNVDIAQIDTAMDNIGPVIDTLESQLRALEQRGAAWPVAASPGRLDDVRAYLDYIDSDFLLDAVPQETDAAWLAGRKAHAVLDDMAVALVGSAEASLRYAQVRQRLLDIAASIGLLLLYLAIMAFGMLFYRSREAAAHSRELAREIDQRRVREHELMQLNELSELLMSCATRAEAYDVFGRAVSSMFPSSYGGLAILAPATRELRLVAEWGAEARLPPSFPMDNCLAMAQGQPQIRQSTQDVACCSHFLTSPHRGHACLPLAVRGQIFGLLWLESGNDKTGIDGCLQLAASAGEAVKLALSNIQLRDALQEQAIRDALTGIYNRRYLHEVFPHEQAQAIRANQSLSLVLLDIDHFKQINDRYGHDAGDQALIALAQHLRDSLRASDLCFRLGGEEFVLLLRTDLAGAVKCADNLRVSFHDREFSLADGQSFRCTFSAGVAEASLAEEKVELLLQQADGALYRAKSEGRNRVETAVAVPLT